MKKRYLIFTLIIKITAITAFLALASCAQQGLTITRTHEGSKKCVYEKRNYSTNVKYVFDNGYNVRKTGLR